MRRAAGAIAAALLLAGCPIPQPLPDYPPGAITPPRILTDEIASNESAVQFVPAGCATEPVYPLAARILDTIASETIVARWFVNYDARFLASYTPWQASEVAPDPDPSVLTRQLPPFTFQPYQHPPPPGSPSGPGPLHPEPGVMRVVELVVSNGFDPNASTTAYPRPNRTPLPGFETQVYRWVFLSVVPDAACTAGAPGCCP